MVDVGANWGYYTLIWCAGSADGKVEAVEASPRNQTPLVQNVELNALTARVRVNTWAASDKYGEITFNTGGATETGWGGIAADSAPITDVVTVPCRRLDEVFVGRQIEMLKIDCEGADALVLEGARGLLKQHLVKQVVFEENSKRQLELGIAPGTSARILRECGYTVNQLGLDPGLQNYHAVCQ